MRASLVALVLLAGTASGQFAEFPWTFDNPCGSGSIQDDAMHVVGCGVTSGYDTPTLFRSVAPYAGTVYTRAEFFNHDIFWGLDDVAFEVAGVVDYPHINFEQWFGNLAFDVPGGATFGLGALSEDGIDGPAEVDLTRFRFFPDGVTLRTDALQAGDGFGAALASIGDVNGDGVPDVLAGAPLSDVAGVNAGRALVLSGADGAVLLDLQGATAGEQFGAAVDGTGDIDGDSIPDFIVGAPLSGLGGLQAGAASLFSGATGALLHVFVGEAVGDTLGAAVAGPGDCNGDGTPDVLLGAPLNDEAGNKAGLVRLFSGATHGTLLSVTGLAVRDQFGTVLDGPGDADGDGLPDLLVGAPLAHSGGINRGSVTLLSGSSGAVIQQWLGPADDDQYGAHVAAVGDVNGDGLGDVLMGNPVATGPQIRLVSAGDGSVLQVHGANDLLEKGFFGGQLQPSNAQLGEAVGSAGDVDDDGVPDIQFKARLKVWPIEPFHKYATLVFVFSGRDGDTLLEVLHGAEGNSGYATALTSAGDLDGDGRGDLLVGDTGDVEFGFLLGALETVTTRALWADLGHGLAGVHGTPTLEGVGLLAPGTPVIVSLSHARENAPTYLAIGVQAVNLPFAGGVLVPAFQAPFGTLLNFTTDAAGAITLPSTWPAGLPSGLSIWMQTWTKDAAAAAGKSASNAVRATVP